MLDWLCNVWGFFSTLTWNDPEQLIVSIVGALLGTVGGAWAARTGAREAKTRDLLLAGIQSAHKVGTLAITISNTAISWKKQYLREITARYKDSLTAAIAYRAARDRGEKVPPEFGFAADLNTLPALDIATETLRELVLAGSFRPRPISAALVLHQQTLAYERINAQRNAIVEAAKAAGGIDGDSYFGFRRPDGHTDRTYHDLMLGLADTLDDIIFYAWTLGQDAISDGEKASKAYTQKFGRSGIPLIAKASLPAEHQGLMPVKDLHAEWLTGFKDALKPETLLKKWWRLLQTKLI